MANEQNLKEPWKKGQSGNPKGRPKGAISISSLLKKVLDRKITVKEIELTGEKDCKKKVQELIAMKLASEALNGNVQAAKEIFDRIEGKSVQGMKISGADGGPLETVMIYVPDNGRDKQ